MSSTALPRQPARRIYLDNAATSMIKPPAVAEAVARFLSSGAASAGRGAYGEALQAGRAVRQCRERLCRLLNGLSPDHCILTFNCTDALNLAIKGWLRPGDHVVTTLMDHNSVLRPLNDLAKRSHVRVTFVEADPRTAIVEASAVRSAITRRTRLVAVNHASNVTGSIQPIGDIGEICREKGVTFLVDAAQSCGHVPLDVRSMNIDFLAAPGHKGLLGPLGTGFLYVRPGLEEELRSLKEGGTGSISELPVQPSTVPDKYECGSHNVPGIAGLGASLEWILGETVEKLRRHELALCEVFLDALRGVAGIEIHGPVLPPEVDRRVGVFSVRAAGFEPLRLSAELEARFGVLTRSGVHCAPFAHQTIGTLEQGGTTRFSFGALTTEEDVLDAAAALRDLTNERESPHAAAALLGSAS